jgi:26S proteasome regulatory subunit N5
MSLNTRKQERDYTAEVKALQPEVESLAKVRHRGIYRPACRSSLTDVVWQVARGGREDLCLGEAESQRASRLSPFGLWNTLTVRAQAADMSSTSTLLTLLARLCWEAGNLELLNSELTTMSKKHGQLKEAVVRMVDEAMTFLPELRKKKDAGEYRSGKDRWLELVKSLRDITEGKVSCHSEESERALTFRSTSSWRGRD